MNPQFSGSPSRLLPPNASHDSITLNAPNDDLKCRRPSSFVFQMTFKPTFIRIELCRTLRKDVGMNTNYW